MAQFGMQMPGGRAAKSAGPDVYTAMAFIASAAMLAAVVMLWLAASRVSPDGSPLSVQEAGAGKVDLSS